MVWFRQVLANAAVRTQVCKDVDDQHDEYQTRDEKGHRFKLDVDRLIRVAGFPVCASQSATPAPLVTTVAAHDGATPLCDRPRAKRPRRTLERRHTI